MRPDETHAREASSPQSAHEPRLRVAGLLVKNGSLLLVRQAKEASTYWLLPGGGVRRGEPLREALQREFAEETGLSVEVLRPVGVAETISPDRGASRHVVHLIYLVQLAATAQDLLPCARDPAVLEVGWHSAACLNQLSLRPPIADLLRRWLQALVDGVAPPFLEAGVRWVE